MAENEVHPKLSAFLVRRGLEIHRHSPTDELIFDALDSEQEEALLREMKRYSVRLLLRDVIRFQGGFTIDMLGSFSSTEEKKRMAGVLLDIGIIAREGERMVLRRRPIRSFGPTLEWFICRLMEREFASPAVWGTRFRKVESGGDFDVISAFEDELVYIEVKSAPPKGVEVNEVAAFLKRVNALLPRAALFFVDTELRMRDRIVLLFHEQFLRSLKDPFPRRLSIENLEREIFHINHRIFILNSARDISKNFGVCFRDFLSYGLKVI